MKKLYLIVAAFAAWAMFAMPVVVVEKDAPAYENTAARELAKYLGKIALPKGSFEVANSAGSPFIHVGKSPEALKVFDLKSWDELQMDEVLYKVDDAGNLWIAGEGTRGTLYAVYDCLENEYGCRFFADDDEKVPKMEKFTLPVSGTKHRYAPFFMVRSLHYQQVMEAKDPSFPVKMRHSFGGNNPPEWGGLEAFIGPRHVHTFDILIPADKYFADHPEWFAFRDGKRQNLGKFSQLCLTNKAMRKELIRNALALCEKYPDRHFISISQNDSKKYCLCDECEAFVKAHGNQTDLLLDCVNEVADAIAAKYPHVYVDTLAYQYTRQPPKSVMPHKNVVIRYCTIEQRQFFPLQASQNQKLHDEMVAWQKIAPQMMIWNYLTSFYRYTAIHPNWKCIAPDLRFARECHAINILEQGSWNHGGKAADLTDLRIYLVSRLMWNPDLDPETLIHEFCDHYYGPGAKYVYDYLAAVTAAVARHPECPDTCFYPYYDHFLSDAELVELWKNLFDGAKALEMDVIYGPRLAIAALSVTITLLEHPALFDRDLNKRLPALRDVDPNALLVWCCKVIPLAKLDVLHEMLHKNDDSTQKWVDQTKAVYEK